MYRFNEERVMEFFQFLRSPDGFFVFGFMLMAPIVRLPDLLYHELLYLTVLNGQRIDGPLQLFVLLLELHNFSVSLSFLFFLFIIKQTSD